MPSYSETIAAARRSLLIGLPPLPKRLVMLAPQPRHERGDEDGAGALAEIVGERESGKAHAWRMAKGP